MAPSDEPGAPADVTDLVSVIVTTRNEAKNIENCLRSIRLQTWPAIEVIVVDNASTDATKALSEPLADTVVDLGPERSAQRNHGIIDLARGEFAMYVDADMVIGPTLVEAAVRYMRGHPCVALHIDETVLGRGYLSAIRRFERGFYSGTVVDGARFFRRSTIVEIGGFDRDMPPGPEDWDLDKRLKQLGPIDLLPHEHTDWQAWPLAGFVRSRGIELPQPYTGLFHNEAEQSLPVYLKKKAYYSGSMDHYATKWGADDPDVRRQLGLAYRFFGVFVEHGRWKRLVRRPDLAVSMFALRILVGVTFLWQRRRS